MKKKIVPLFLVVLLGALAFFALSKNTRPVPVFSVSGLQGEVLNQNTLQGQVSLLNFWYPSCPGCDKEMPMLIHLNERFSDSLNIYAISLNHNTEAEVRAYTAAKALPFHVFYDQDNRVAKAFKIQFTPSTFLIDAEGNIVRSYVGEPDWEEVGTKIRTLLEHGKKS